MIRVDRNLQESVNILQDSHLSWQPNDTDFILDPKEHHQLPPPTPTDPPRDRSSSLSPAPDTNSPQTQPEAPSSPPLPVAAEEKEEPVKVPQREEEEEEETRVEKASRLSTPLSELSPPPDDLDVTVDSTAPTANELKSNLDSASLPGAADPSETAISSTKSPDRISLDALPSQNISLSSPSSVAADASASKSGEHKAITILNLNSELLHVCMEFQKKSVPTSDALYHHYSQRLHSNLAWLAAIAESRPTTTMSLPIIDPPPPVDFYSCERIQQLYSDMPGFFAKEITRRQQLGIPLTIPGSGLFQTLNPSQKRERSEDSLPDPASKRQNIGDVKPPPSQLMPPPPSVPNLSPTPTSNPSVSPVSATSAGPSIPNGQTGPSTPTITSQPFSQQSPDTNVTASQAGIPQQSLLNSQEAQMMASARARQAHVAQLRAQQHQQQLAVSSKQANAMLGASNAPTQGVGPTIGMNTPSAGGGAGQMSHGPSNANAAVGLTMQQAVQILQNPSHPIIQYLMRAVPGFQSLNQQVQIQKIAMAAIQMQNRIQQSDQQRVGGSGMPNVQQMQGMSMQNSAGGMSFLMANANPAQFSALGMGHQNNMFPAGMQNPNPGAVAGAGGISGMNMNSLSPHQRQLLLMQQQQRAGGNLAMGNVGVGTGIGSGASGGPGTMMSPQQIGLSQQQQHQQHHHQQQQQRIGVNMGSPMLGGTNDFAALRSTNPIPGIARSTRSPSDSSSSSMAPRPSTVVSRGASLGPDDYQRMMMKQQQGQNPQGNMFGSPGGAAQGMMGGNWAGQQGGGMGMGQSPGQNQNLQLQGMQMQGGYGMSSPIQAQQQPQQLQQAQSAVAGLGSFMGGVSASPPPMGVSSPTSWAGSPTQQGSMGAGGGGMSGMFSPFSPTGSSLGDISRHMSGSQQSQTSSLAGSQDDYSGLFDWPS